MTSFLITWTGLSDRGILRDDFVAAEPDEKTDCGPLYRILWQFIKKDKKEVNVHFIIDQTGDKRNLQEDIVKKLVEIFKLGKIAILHKPLTNPTDYKEIHTASLDVINKAISEFRYVKDDKPEVWLNLSSGTAQMQVIFIWLKYFQFTNFKLVSSGHREGVIKNPQPLISFESDKTEDVQIIGSSEALKKALELAKGIAKFALKKEPRKPPLFILGETGTGKELFAKRITTEVWKGTIYPVNCAGFTETLIDSELFGHTKGAFTGAEHDKTGIIIECYRKENGVLFLDEIGDLPMPAQAKFLRFLEDRKVRKVGSSKPENETCDSLYIICATNKNIKEMMRNGTFRTDLYMRLIEGGAITLPSLCERDNDVIEIAEKHLGKEHKGLLESDSHGNYLLPNEVAEAVRTYNWPGNVRELKSVLNYASVLAEIRGVPTLNADLVGEAIKIVGLLTEKTDKDKERIEPAESAPDELNNSGYLEDKLAKTIADYYLNIPQTDTVKHNDLTTQIKNQSIALVEAAVGSDQAQRLLGLSKSTIDRAKRELRKKTAKKKTTI